MPTKKPSLFDFQGSEPKKEKAPTLLQYLKSNADHVFPIVSTIRVIWYPGNWENYSIETDAFRAGITPKHALFEPMEMHLTKRLIDTETALLLSVMDAKGTICFTESSLYGHYSAIGVSGFKFNETNLAIEN